MPEPINNPSQLVDGANTNTTCAIPHRSVSQLYLHRVASGGRIRNRLVLMYYALKAARLPAMAENSGFEVKGGVQLVAQGQKQALPHQSLLSELTRPYIRPSCQRKPQCTAFKNDYEMKISPYHVLHEYHRQMLYSRSQM